jgi:glycosyltransferase involved in cell wall biosynthesis
MNHSVSVIIPNHNYGQFLNKTINSVLEQTHTSIEVIIVDNGSTDNSRDILEGYGKSVKTVFQADLGQAQARNNGLSKAQGSLIALLDADDYWEPTKIEKQIGLFESDYQFVYSGMRQFESVSNTTVKVIEPNFKGDCRMAFLKHPSRSIVPGGESSAIFTRDLVDSVGKFDVTLSSASGRDFFRRCSAKTKFNFVNESLINYRIHDSNMSKDSQLIMSDTNEAYRLLFEDPEWIFAQPFRRKCLSELHWSFFKTFIKRREFLRALPELIKTIGR